MKYEIKQLNDTDAVVISGEEIKINGWFISIPRKTVHKCTSIFENNLLDNTWQNREQVEITKNDCKKIIATISPFKIEGLPMLELPNQEDVEKLALNKFLFPKELFIEMKNCSQNDYLLEEQFGMDITTKYREILGFKEGYKAAQKQFSESDMINAFIEGSNSGVQFQSTCEDDYGEAELCAKSDLEYFKQSLQKKQFPIAVELTEDLQVIKWYYK